MDVVCGSLQSAVCQKLCVFRAGSLSTHGDECCVLACASGQARANLAGAQVGQVSVLLLNPLGHSLRGDDSCVGTRTFLSSGGAGEHIHRTGLAHGHVARGRCGVHLRLQGRIAEARHGTNDDANNQ